jgi:hypothetical protein
MNKELLQESQLVSVAVVYLIIKKLCTPFDQTSAFKLGIIDQYGNVLRKRNTLKTREELAAYTVLDTMIFKIKRMIEMLPGGKSRLATFSAALWLLKEANNYDLYTANDELLESEISDFISNFKLDEQNKKLFELVQLTEEQNTQNYKFTPEVKNPDNLSKSFIEMYEKLSGPGLVGHASQKEEKKDVYDPVIGNIRRKNPNKVD